MRTQPAGAVSGSDFTTQPVVEIHDAAGNLVVSSTASVAATLTPTTSTLAGTATVTAIGGVATFTNLGVTGTDSVTLSFAATGLTSASSAKLAVLAPPAIALASATASLTGVVATSILVTQAIAITNTISYAAGQPTILPARIPATIATTASSEL